MELKWPITKCDCGYDLREAEVRASEKSNDASGKLTWTCFCPGCGRGYNVGERGLPAPTAEVLAERDAAPALAFIEDKPSEGKPKVEPTKEPSGIPPDVRGAALAKTEEENPDPENLISQETGVKKPEETQEPGAIKPPGKGEYFCTKCASNHKDTDKPKSIGLRHKKYQEA